MVRRKHDVIAVGRPPGPPQGFLPSEHCQLLLEDFDLIPDSRIIEHFRGCDAVIFGGGADGRNSFPIPAIDGFRRANVEPTRRLVRLAKEAGVDRFIILASYYTAIARTFPDLGILDPNPYILSRKEQADAAFAEAGSHLSVGILELPYIFGAAPGMGTLWGFYLDLIEEHDLVPTPPGGTACVTAAQVGQAIAGASERLHGHRHFAIVDSNHPYHRIYSMFAEAMGLDRGFVTKDADEALATAARQREAVQKSGTEGAYDPVSMAQMQQHFLHLDPLPAMEALGFGPDDLQRAINDTVTATRLHSKR
jgi:nucleoside-diphosphate-sugar epimerase